ncbi:MAG TPA: hypothetical protein DEP35_08665 [Deltaproteobacteria bacterium]|nr:hypothetical protein [Deltaproteobacteria bacterium]
METEHVVGLVLLNDQAAALPRSPLWSMWVSDRELVRNAVAGGLITHLPGACTPRPRSTNAFAIKGQIGPRESNSPSRLIRSHAVFLQT